MSYSVEQLLSAQFGDAPRVRIPPGLYEIFPHQAIQRGHNYYEQQRVRALVVFPEQCHISSTVIGSARRPYQCRVEWRGDAPRYQWKSLCTCPMSVGCKHAVATLLKALPELPPAVTLSLGTTPSMAPQAPPPMHEPRPYDDFQVRSWLTDLRKQLEPPAPPKEVAEQILYLLHQDPAGYARRGIRVKPVIVRPLKSGGFSTPRHFGGALQAPARFVRPDDLEILHECRARQSSYDVRLEGAWGAKMLAVLLKTGRTHWQEPGQALRQGAQRAGAFRWAVMPDGRQQLTLAVDQATPLPTAPPWYYDARTRELGPIESGLPDAVAAELLHAPLLSAEQALSLAAELPSVLGPLAACVPLPARIEVRQQQGVKPIPHLRLMRETLPVYSGYGQVQHQESDCARLWFDYDGIRVNPGQAGMEVTETEGQVVRKLARDFVLEQKAQEQLTSAGLAPVPGAEREGALFSGYEPVRWLRFLDAGLPRLKRRGWQIEIEPDFETRLLEPDAQWAAELSEAGQQWFDLALDITVAGQRQPLLPMLVSLLRSSEWRSAGEVAQIADRTPIYVRLAAGGYVKLAAARIKPILTTLLELFDERPLTADGRLRLPRLAAAALPEMAAAGDMRMEGAPQLLALAQKLRNSQGIVEVAIPAGLRAELRTYQKQGLNWLQFLREHELGGALADDMGLGKTVQALAHLLLEKESGRADRPSLVVAPTSLIFNWQHEAARFAPSLKVLALQGLKRKADFERIVAYDLVLTTYPLLPRDHAVLAKQDYHLLILDEAQFVKNAKSKSAQLVRNLKSRHRLCLTGTPMENHLGELWALMDFLAPGFLSDAAGFKRRYRTPIEKHGDALVQQQLSRRVAPFLLRRTKNEVAQELPPRTDIVRSVALEGAQRELYETVRLAMDKKVREEIARRGLARSHIMILDALLKLRQICCDPRLLKMDAAKAVRESAKLSLLMDLLPEMLEEGRRVLLFSQFTSMLDLIKAELAERKIEYAELRGDTVNRAEPVRRFQTGEVPLFLISLKAGGVGLNLTAADTVIHYDPWWNPAVEQQATDRAHRIGQDKPVFVYKLLTEGTVEEKIVALQARKRALADALFQEGGSALGLKPEDLAELFAPL